jgi:hypothetical protein
MRNCLYWPVAANLIDWDSLKSTIERVNWDVRELPSQPNSYVMDLLAKLKTISSSVTDLIEKRLNGRMPKAADRQLWTDLSRLTFRTLIDGFAGAKKCSYGGRAAMRLDLQHLATGMYELARQRPLPDQDLAEQFITAFFYNEAQLEELVRLRNRYSVRQIRAVIQCALVDNRKARSRLLAMLEQQPITPDLSPT